MIKTYYVVTCPYRDDHLFPTQVDIFKPSNETSQDKVCLMKLCCCVTSVSVGMSVSKSWGWNPKAQKIHSQRGVPQVGAGVPHSGGDNQPFRPFLYSTILSISLEMKFLYTFAVAIMWTWAHFHKQSMPNQQSHFFFPALWMLKQQFCAKGTGGFYAPAGPHGRDSHNKGLQVFPISLWLFLSNSICWNASCLLLKKAQCLAMQGACLSFNCPPTLNILRYLDRSGAQWEPLTSKTSLQCGRLWRGKGDPEMW